MMGLLHAGHLGYIVGMRRSESFMSDISRCRVERIKERTEIEYVVSVTNV